MNQKVLYSVMGLAAMPMVQTVAQNQNWSGTTMTVAPNQVVSDASTAEPLSFNIGKLAPGFYNLSCNLTSKVYDVTVKVTGAKAEAKQVCNNPSTNAQDVNIAFQVVDDTKDIVISFESSDPGVSGAGYSFTALEVGLSFDFATVKTTLSNNAQALANTISGYNYAAKQEDVDAANALKTKAENVKSSYDDYKNFKLYANPNEIQKEINALAESAAAKEAVYQNEQAYGRVNAEITAIKAKYNAAVAELEETLVGVAAYLLDGALDKLNTDINLKITEATKASYDSYQAGTAVADEATNKGLVPTEGELNAIVNDYKTQATDNINAYNALHARVTALQAQLDAVVPVAAIASLFPKTEPQNAINAVNTKVEGAKNSAAQLTLNIDAEETAAQGKITEYKNKVDKANAEYTANEATTTAIAAVQKKLDDAKTAVNAKVSKDGQYKAQDYYAKYVEDVQKEINTLTTDAGKAYKADGTGTAQAYNAALNTAGIEAEITAYQTNAIAAVNKYDALMTAINGADAEHPGYQGQLDAARAEFEPLPIYNDPDPNYDYKTKLDLIQKRINEIKKAIAAAQEKVGADHWTDMLAIDEDAAITADIATLLAEKQNMQNQYDKDYLNNGLNSLATSITKFGTTYATGGDTKLGDDYAVFAAAENEIAAKRAVIEGEKNAVDPAAADAAATIQALGARITTLQAEQTALETAAAAVAAKVAANTSAQTTLATNIDNLQNKIVTFKNTYKIGQDDSTLGNRGKAGGEITNEVGDIEATLNTLEGENNAVDVTEVNPVDKTDEVDKTTNGWKLKDINLPGQNYQVQNSFGFPMVEQWKSGDVSGKGIVFIQEVEGLENGVYDVVLQANAVDQRSGNPNKNRTDIVEVFANDATAAVQVSGDGNAAVRECALNNVIVSNGTLTMGLRKLDAGTNWHAIQIKSLTYHENDQLAVYNNVDPKPEEAPDTDGLTVKYNKLYNQEKALETAAPGIKTDVANNAATKTAADKAVTDLQAAELNTLKNLKNVTNANAVSDDATAVKADPAGFKVFETGLDAGKSYTAKKAAIDADITAMSNAIATSAAAEKLTKDWKNNSITVGEGDNAKTYSINELTGRINALKNEAKAESDNWEAYKALEDNNMSKLLPDTITVDPADMGAGAVAYYQGLKDNYIAGKATILTNMQKSLNDRKAVADKSTFEDQITDLINKVKVVKSDGIANKKKYDEQVKAYTETQTLWNNTYTEIAATDHSTQVQSWLDQLDAIQVDLTAATEAVEANYPVGKSVAEAQDFAALQARINDVKAQQNEGYNAQIAADNAAAHNRFNVAIAAATSAYQTAVQERAKYSTTNDDIKDVVNGAAADLDDALYSCPTEIETLTNDENTAYAAVTSPTVYDETQYVDDANDIKNTINGALNTFKAKVKTALEDFWTGTDYKPAYEAKVTVAKGEIADYSDNAKKDAFKDVEDLIAKGDAGVNSLTLSEIEAAIDGLANIDEMLDSDKDAAAVNDLTPRFATADAKYNEVKAYIEGVSNDINEKQEALEDLELVYEAVTEVKELPKNFENRDNIKKELDMFVQNAENLKAYVENAVAGDNANTEAYNDIMAAIEPVEAKLAEAEAAAAPYKYSTSFDTAETLLGNVKYWADKGKNQGSAVAYKAGLLNDVANLDIFIDATLIDAFWYEWTNLADDITELKNQYNAYVAANGLNETANDFKAAIDDYETQLAAIDIFDLDDPADGIDYDDILAATEAMIELQNSIADLETELLEANANTANADVLASFTAQLDELAATASLEGYDAWVGEQPYGNTTLDAEITALQAQIAELQAAIEAEPNISFYKDQYQDQINAIKTDLVPVAAAITAYQAQFEANAAAYADLTAELDRLQALVDAATEKVGTYKYAADYQSLLMVDAQDEIDWYRDGLDSYNDNVNAQNFDNDTDFTWATGDIENQVQNYLDICAHHELEQQEDALITALNEAIEAKYVANKYSSALWARLKAEKNRINSEISDLDYEIWNSYQTWESTSKNVWKKDANNHYIYKDRTSDADYAAQMETVAAIQAEIADLSDAVDNIGLLGDANEDGKVNVLDYQKVLNMILDPTLQPEEDTNLFANIDINQSTVIEVGDLTAIVNNILDHNWEYGYAAVKSFNFSGSSENLTMSVAETQNGVQRFAVNLQNNEDYTAFQLDMVLPEGMTIVGTSLSERAGESHKLYSRAQQDGSVRLLASSITGESFSGNEGAVLYIDVKTNANFKGGSVELMNILFSDVYAQTRAFSVGAEGQATGIDLMATMQSLKQKVYDLSGRVMNGMMKGINIIQGVDGTTKKVLK